MTPPKASDAAIERACVECSRTAEGRGMGAAFWDQGDYALNSALSTYANHLQALSDALRAEHGDSVPASLAGFVLPVVVDPIRQAILDALDAYCAAGGSALHADDFSLDAVEIDRVAAEIFVETLSRAIAAQGGAR